MSERSTPTEPTKLPTAERTTAGSKHKLASELVHELAPECSTDVFTNLERECINDASELALLDKNDLKDLGLKLLERCKIYNHLQDNFVSKAFPSDAPRPPMDSSPPLDSLMRFGSSAQEKQQQPHKTVTAERAADFKHHGGSMSRQFDSEYPEDRSNLSRRMSYVSLDLFGAHTEMITDAEVDRLDAVEQRIEFWCSLVRDVESQEAQMMETASLHRHDLTDVRENVLEPLFNVSPEEVKDKFLKLDKNRDGKISESELAEGLEECGVRGLTSDALGRLHEEVAHKHDNLTTVHGFASILTRLKMAQLLCKLRYKEPLPGQQPGLDFTVIDYNRLHRMEFQVIDAEQLRSFFFGHRPREQGGEPSWVRWVHLSGLMDGSKQNDDPCSPSYLTLLLGLTLKYQLHPLAVEDVIQQSQTKFDRYASGSGDTYFAAVEQLVCIGSSDGRSPVRVCGRHTTIFCAGLPHFDTVITVTQPDSSFLKDWPQAKADEADHDGWVRKLRARLQRPRSRVRESRAVFLMLQVVDLSTDDLMAVVKAFVDRLRFLEHQTSKATEDWAAEVSHIRLQLDVVTRRLRGLQRILRKWKDDQVLTHTHSDLCEDVSGHVQDVLDHLEDAGDDANHQIEKCQLMIASYERAVDRDQKQKQKVQDDAMNFWLFVLTIATFIFAPVQFFAGVYGMNFVDANGTPTIPELLVPNGYQYFWIGVIVYLAASTCIASWFWRYSSSRRGAPNEKQHTNCNGEVDGDSQHIHNGSEHDVRKNQRMVATTADDDYHQLPG